MSKKLILNSLSGTMLYGINIVVVFIMSPIIIRVLGNRDYGLWELVMSVIGYMGLLDLGIGPAMVRFVAVADGKQDRVDLQRTISTAFAFFLGAGALALSFFFVLSYSPQLIAGGQTKDIANVGTVFLLLGVNACLSFPLQVFITTLMGVQRHYFINFTRAFLAIIRALIVFFLFRHYPGYGLILLALLEPFFTFAQFLLFAGAVYYDKAIPNLAISAVSFSKLKELFTFGVKSTIMLVASRLQNQSVPLIIANVIGLGSVVYFVMPNRLVDYAKGLTQAVGFPLAPYFGASIGRGDTEGLVSSWLKSSLALQVFSLAAPLAILFYGEVFLSIWIGQEYATAGRWVIIFLLFGLVADALAINAMRILMAQGLHGRCALIWLILSIFSIPLGIVGASNWGLAGVTLGTTLVMVLGSAASLVLACSSMQVSLKRYFNETVMRLMFPLIVLVFTLFVQTNFMPVKTYIDILFQILVGGSIYMIAVWRFTLENDVRDKLLVHLKLKRCSYGKQG